MQRNDPHMRPRRDFFLAGDHTMRMFETAASTALVIAVQALVVGAIITAL